MTEQALMKAGVDNGSALAVVDEETINKFLLGSELNNALTAGEKVLFRSTCTALNLNPLKREIYAVKYGRDFDIITGYEVYLKRAARLRLVKSWDVKTKGKLIPHTFKKWDKKNRKYYDVDGWVSDPKDPFQATITINRADWDKPFTWTVDWEEYNGKNSMWFGKPRTMIKKVVMGQGFRLCFPDEFDGFPYMQEELDAHHTEQTAPDVEPALTINQFEAEPVDKGTVEAEVIQPPEIEPTPEAPAPEPGPVPEEIQNAVQEIYNAAGKNSLEAEDVDLFLCTVHAVDRVEDLSLDNLKRAYVQVNKYPDKVMAALKKIRGVA